MGAGLKRIALFIVALILAISADVLLASTGGCTTLVYGDATRGNTGKILLNSGEEKPYFNKNECLPGTQFPIASTEMSMDKNIVLLPTKAKSVDLSFDAYYCRNAWKEEGNHFICP